MSCWAHHWSSAEGILSSLPDEAQLPLSDRIWRAFSSCPIKKLVSASPVQKTPQPGRLFLLTPDAAAAAHADWLTRR